MTDQNKETTRDALRASIFSSENSRYKRTPLNFKGTDLEIKQPTLTQVAEMWTKETSTERALYLLINLAYIPGTDILVFEEGDIADIIAMPYGPEFTRINEILADFLNGNAKEAEKNSEATPTSTTSTQ